MTDSTYGLVQSSLLEKIDRLFACNAGTYVDLPQLVVVGKQSSGKSSVLVALTGLPFPRDSELCTRFATQIIFRRAATPSIGISIIPSKDSSSDHQQKMKAWSKQQSNKFDASSFARIMVEVTSVMGVTSTATDGSPQAFSKDILAIEIAGPNEEHFSIIDVPGTFTRTTAGLTTKDDMALVEDMVHGYMANPRSVMLIVVPCNDDIANQTIIEKAEDLDPEGDRTFGILTKPDLVDLGAENSVVELIDGKRQKLKLGWHLLKNPGQSELVDASVDPRRLEQRFFDTKSPWNTLDKDRVGIKSLRVRLQEILAGHIRREFPKVKAEIIAKLKKVHEVQRSLGPKRHSQFEQREFLTDIAAKFQEIAALAVRAEYGRSGFFDTNDELRLATAAVNRGESFAVDLQNFGHQISFDSSGDTADIVEVDLANMDLTMSPSRPTRSYSYLIDIDGLDMGNREISEPHGVNIMGWLKSVYRRSRGFELGTFDPALLATAMKSQAQKWRDLALGYVSDVITLVHHFVMQLLDHIVPGNARVRDGIASFLADRLRQRYEEALNRTEFLVSVELEGTPATYNHYFKETLDKNRQARLQQQVSTRSIEGCKHGPVVRIEDMVKTIAMSNDDHITREIHDILRSYYKLSRKRFVDNVRMQVADYFLVTGPDTPLKLFSPKVVAAMTTEQLEEIAGEEVSVKRQRAELERDMKRLEEGKIILR